MASQQPVWTETETCELCGGKVTFSLRNLSTKTNSWNMHLLSNKHKLHMTTAVPAASTKAPVAVKASVAPKTTSETCHECGGCVKYHANDVSKANSWKWHMLSIRHKQHTATGASAAPTKAPVAAPVQHNYVTEPCRECGGTIKYLCDSKNSRDAARNQHVTVSTVHIAWAAARKPAATPVKESQAPMTTSECRECGGSVRYHSNDAAMKANSWKLHMLSKKHMQHMATVPSATPSKTAVATPTKHTYIIEPCAECVGKIKYIRGCANDRDAARNQHVTVSTVHTKWAATRKPPPKPVTAPQATKTMSGTCRECGGHVTFPMGMPSMKTNCWKLHMTSNHHRQHVAAAGSAAPVKTPVAMPARQHVVAPAATKAPLPPPPVARALVSEVCASTPPECSAVTAARAFARRNCFAGAFSVVIGDDSPASPYQDELTELKSTTFRRAASARDAIVDFVALTGHAFMESELKIISVPRHSLQHSQRSLRRREVPTVESGTKRAIVGARPFAVGLLVYKLPVDLRYEIPYPDTEAACRQRLKQSSYAIDPTEHLHNLLYCEEACVRASLREYDIEEGVFSRGRTICTA